MRDPADRERREVDQRVEKTTEVRQRQLGHADPATTRRHYARWLGAEYEYREPFRLEPGQIAADVLAVLGEAVGDDVQEGGR